jgi:alkanesulfonate monooxygenase SsuD/methylene tetrahydromethanopterin reductase-like flavin-dependent oxidoreductase (luciferase family)
MKFGLFFLNEKPPNLTDEQVVDYALEQCVMADEWGYDVLFLGEHHFAPYGTMADCAVFGGAVATLTKQILISNAVMIPAFVHPVRVAEQVAMLDVMSHGRYMPGFGRGYQQREFRGYGIDQEESSARFREALQIIDGLLSREVFTYHGNFWSFDELKLAPRPVQQPRPPIYVGAIKTPESVDWMIQNDYLPLTGNPYAQPRDAVGMIKDGTWIGSMILDAQRKYGKEVTLDHSWGLMHNIVCAETDEEAARMFRETWEFGNELMFTYTKVVEEGPIPEDYKHYAGGMSDFLKNFSYDDMLNFPGSLVGSPDKIIERLQTVYETTGMKNHLMWMNRGGLMPQQDQLRSMEMFAREVIPAVRHIGEKEEAFAAAAAGE